MMCRGHSVSKFFVAHLCLQATRALGAHPLLRGVCARESESPDKGSPWSSSHRLRTACVANAQAVTSAQGLLGKGCQQNRRRVDRHSNSPGAPRARGAPGSTGTEAFPSDASAPTARGSASVSNEQAALANIAPMFQSIETSLMCIHKGTLRIEADMPNVQKDVQRLRAVLAPRPRFQRVGDLQFSGF